MDLNLNDMFCAVCGFDITVCACGGDFYCEFCDDAYNDIFLYCVCDRLKKRKDSEKKETADLK
jgi:hypothetical protein